MDNPNKFLSGLYDTLMLGYSLNQQEPYFTEAIDKYIAESIWLIGQTPEEDKQLLDLWMVKIWAQWDCGYKMTACNEIIALMNKLETIRYKRNRAKLPAKDLVLEQYVELLSEF